MLICNRTRQIYIPREALEAIVIEFVRPIDDYSKPDESAIAQRMEGGLKKPVEVKFIGKMAKFSERYLSEEDACSDILRMETAFANPVPGANVPIVSMCSLGQRDAYDEYAKEYQRIHKSIAESRVSAFSARLKGEIK